MDIVADATRQLFLQLRYCLSGLYTEMARLEGDPADLFVAFAAPSALPEKSPISSTPEDRTASNQLAASLIPVSNRILPS